MRKHRHIGAYGAIIEDDKIVLIVKARGAYTGLLDLPGGGIEHAENPNDTIKREIEEETGLIVKNINLLDIASCNVKWEDSDGTEDLHHLGIFYKVDCHKSELKKDPDGLDSLGASWYEIKDLTKEQVSPFTIMILEKLGYIVK